MKRWTRLLPVWIVVLLARRMERESTSGIEGEWCQPYQDVRIRLPVKGGKDG